MTNWKNNRQLILGIDIDGTITQPDCFLPHLNRAFSKNFTLADVEQYDLHLLYDVPEAVMGEWFYNNNEKIYASAPLKPDAKQVLAELAAASHRLIFISAREERDYEVTYKWLHAHALPYDDVHLIGSHDKIATARKQEVQLFFEDRYDNACELSETLAIPVFLFDTPYNQGVLPPHVFRVQSWYDVPPLLEQLQEMAVDSTYRKAAGGQTR
ncbi:5' nucleotidase, NT5C type [Numidum massiliense]|uniref:5' nucleotidase, NT5C type n=1 Tax=Numidum massiliense TaxID=1522315 RepID=UPI0006D59F64|nr:hypothetical protein [Numidum massiliense]